MEQPILKIEHLSHCYASTWAIKDINLEIKKTGIVGLLGSNGAGKSTIMNITCGVLRHTEGKVLINGIDILEHPEAAKQQLGFLPQHPPLYMDSTVDEYLTYCAHLRSVEKTQIKRALEEVKARCGLTHFNKRIIRNLSGGYRQRVGIAQAIIHKPRLVVLDEPTNGLDPNQILEVRSLIREIAEDRAVIFSSHVLSEVSVLCQDIRMIEQGRMVFADTMDAFNNYIQPHSLLMVMDQPPAEAELMNIPGVSKVDFLTPKTAKIYFDGSETISQHLITASVGQDWRLKEISLDRSSLDEIFAQLSNQKANP